MRALDMIKLAAIAGVAFIGWRAYSAARNAAGDAIEAVGHAFDMAGATFTQAWNNTFSAPASGGDPVRAALYSNEGYTGIDPATGLSPLDGEWYGDAEARRYEAELRALAGSRGGSIYVPAATSINGAAFGIYPKP